MLREMKKFFVTVGVVTVLAGAVYLVKYFNTLRVQARTSELSSDIDNLFAGLQQYKEHVGSYPVGGNAQVAKALMGQNSKNVIILVNRKTRVNEKGEFVDPWNTPLKIYFADNTVLIRSAGPNRRFDDSSSREFDDYIRSN
jgi:hypothetical protein